MCRIAYARFEASVTQERRHEVVTTLLKNSWELGNKDGLGAVMWDAGESAIAVRALRIEDLVLPHTIGRNVLIHARHATCEVSLRNTHPLSAAGAHLVHNGIVYPSGEKNTTMLRKVIRTTNDSEFILKAYLASDRDLYGALDKFEGWANVMLWDERREVLTLFADGEPFHIYRQAGATMLVQEVGQTIGLVISGLGNPYEYAKVDADCVIQLDFGKYPNDFDTAFEEAREGARKKEAKLHTFTGPVGGGYVNYSGYTNNSGYATKGVGGYNANFRTSQASAGYGGKAPVYQVKTGLDRLLEQEREDVSAEDTQAGKESVSETLSDNAKAGAADAEGFRDEDYEQQRRRWSLQIAFEKYQGSGGGSDWNEFVSLQEKRERRTAA
jgi:predicted glutamine amidotransferase